MNARLSSLSIRARRSGFTLIELPTVISIMAVLAGMILTGAAYVQRKAAESKARADMEQIKSVLLEAFRERGSYPTHTAYIGNIQTTLITNLLINTAVSKWAKADLPLVDPWGRSYVYTNATRYSYELLSYGPRGPTFSGDNISNRSSGR